MIDSLIFNLEREDLKQFKEVRYIYKKEFSSGSNKQNPFNK